MSDQKQLQEQVKRVYSLGKRLEALKAEYDSERAALQDYFDKKALKRVEVVTGTSVITASKIERITINYIAEKLKERLDREKYNEIVQKRCIVNNYEGLKELLRKHGVRFKEFSEHVQVFDEVKKDTVKELYEVGDITNEELKGCYTATVTKFIQFKEMKKKNEGG